MKARVRTTPQAEAQTLAAGEWWRANRQASPDLFARELSRNLSVNLLLGYRVVPGALEELRGPSASVGVDFSLW